MTAAKAELRWGRVLDRARAGIDLHAPWKVSSREATAVLELWVRRCESAPDDRALVEVARHIGLDAHARRLACSRRGARDIGQKALLLLD